MNSKDPLEELFQTADVRYDHPNVEEAVMSKVKKQAALRKLKKRYIRVFKMGFACLILLSLILLGREVFFMDAENEAGFLSYVLYPILILFLLFIHLEMIFKLRSN
jgi:hypothetical protein